MSTTGKVTRKGNRVSIVQASPDDPIYSRGFVIGGRRSATSSSDNQENNSSSANRKPAMPPKSDSQSKRVPKTMEEQDQELKEWIETGIYEAAKHQMGE